MSNLRKRIVGGEGTCLRIAHWQKVHCGAFGSGEETASVFRSDVFDVELNVDVLIRF